MGKQIYDSSPPVRTSIALPIAAPNLTISDLRDSSTVGTTAGKLGPVEVRTKFSFHRVETLNMLNIHMNIDFMV